MVQLTVDLQRSSSLLSRSDQDLQSKSDKLQGVQQQLSKLEACSAAAKASSQPSSVPENQVGIGLPGSSSNQSARELHCVNQLTDWNERKRLPGLACMHHERTLHKFFVWSD